MVDSNTTPRVIAVGGGKGGVGTSLVASGLAIFLAQLGKKLFYIDAHSQGPCMANVFGVMRDGSLPPWAPAAADTRGRESSVPNVRVIEAMREDGPVAELPVHRPRSLLRATTADLAVFDLGSGVRLRALDAMLEADAAVTVVTPEPAAIESLWRLARHLFARRIYARLRDLGDEASLDALSTLTQSFSGPSLPVDLAEALGQRSKELGTLAWTELAHFKLRLVVNQSRSRVDLELGDSLVRVSQRRVGPVIEYLGHIEYDDAVFLAARRRRPLLVDAPASKASRNLERIARRLLSLDALRTTVPVVATAPVSASSPPPATHYDLLAIDRGASDEEIRRAYRRTREIYAPESVCLAGLFTDEEVSSMVARVEEARDVLLDPARRRPYDLSITPVQELAMATAFDDEPAIAEAIAQTSPMPEITPDTEITGALFRLVREARGIELRDVSARTKISIAHLEAIEADDFTALPPSVYTRGFVVEFARQLRLDVDHVVRTWFRRYRKAIER
jgi:flagellar biosynthesis protein FlhG